MAQISCPHCAQQLALPEDAAGNSVRCPKCESTFAVPAPPEVKIDEAVTQEAPLPKPMSQPAPERMPSRRDRFDAPARSSSALPIALVLGGIAALGLCACGGAGIMGVFFAGIAHHDMVQEERAVMAEDDMKMDMQLMAEEEMFAQKDWKPEHGEFKRLKARDDAPVRAVSFSSDGNFVLAATAAAPGAESVQSWDLATWKVRTHKLDIIKVGLGNQQVGAATFSPNGDKVFLGRTGGNLSWFDLTREPAPQTNIQIGEVNRQFAFNHIAVSRDGARVCTSHGDSVAYVWEVATRNKIATLKDFQNQVRAAAFHPKSNVVAAWATDVQILDPQTGNVSHLKSSSTSNLRSLAFSPDGRFLSGVDANSQRHWRIEAGKEEIFEPMQFHQHRGLYVAYSPDGRTLAVARAPTQVFFYDPATLRQQFILHMHKDGKGWNEPAAIAFHPDNRRFAVARESTIYLFNLAFEKGN